jgi:hypothetical protein
MRRLSALANGKSVQQRFVALQSEYKYDRFSEKIVRDPLPNRYFRHPTYVMAREKSLSTIWRDIGVFELSVYGLTGFFGMAAYYQA